MPMTQHQRVERTLSQAPEGVCARFFIYQMTPGIPRAAARISELRGNGLDIRTERCNWNHPEDAAAHIMYRLVPAGRLFR